MTWRDSLETIRHKAFRKRYALETELSGLREEHVQTVAELGSVRDELTETREADAHQLADLQLQLAGVQNERQSAQYHVQILEKSLAEAATRERGAEQKIRSLESQLDETRSQQEASLGKTEETLRHLQSEQEHLLSLQSDLTRTFHEVGKQMLETAHTPVTHAPRLSPWLSALLGLLLFLAGALLSGLIVRNAIEPSVNFTPLQESMIGLQRLMQSQMERHEELLKILTDMLNRETAKPEEPPPEPKAVLPKRLLERQRTDLALLGFEAKPSVETALQQFRSLYLPTRRGKPVVSDDEVDSVLRKYAGLARKDSAKYRLKSEIPAAIRLASKRTGVEFAYLMELAATESSFNPRAKASTSSAVGLYQFKEDTWLDTIKVYGHKYGLDAIKQRIAYETDSKGVAQPTISDPKELAAALDLRMQPRMSALLAAEHVRRNKRQLVSSIDRKPERTDLYLTHFFGANGAISFLKALSEDPQKIARELFPGPAKRNLSIFQTRAEKPRTVAEIYRLFARKFNTDRFADGESG